MAMLGWFGARRGAGIYRGIRVCTAVPILSGKPGAIRRPCNLKPQQRDLTPVLRRPVTLSYAMTEAALSEVVKWNPDPSFSVADAILADPEFASVLRMVLRDGYVMVPPLKAKGK
jgi:hypothetical protein